MSTVDARYSVVGQAQRIELAQGNIGFIEVIEVTFTVLDAGGAIGMITVPVNQYTVDNVAALIQPRANQMTAVYALGRE